MDGWVGGWVGGVYLEIEVGFGLPAEEISEFSLKFADESRTELWEDRRESGHDAAVLGEEFEGLPGDGEESGEETLFWWVGGWVGGWVVELIGGEKVVGMRCCG